MPAASVPRRRPGTTILVVGVVAVALGLLLFLVSTVVGAVQGHASGNSALLGIPLALLIGGLSAVTAGALQRSLG